MSMQCHNTWRKVMYNLSLLFGFVAVLIIVVLFCGFREGLLCSRVCVILIFLLFGYFQFREHSMSKIISFILLSSQNELFQLREISITGLFSHVLINSVFSWPL